MTQGRAKSQSCGCLPIRLRGCVKVIRISFSIIALAFYLLVMFFFIHDMSSPPFLFLFLFYYKLKTNPVAKLQFIKFSYFLCLIHFIFYI